MLAMVTKDTNGLLLSYQTPGAEERTLLENTSNLLCLFSTNFQESYN